MEYPTVDFPKCPESPLAIIPAEILSLLETARENPDRIDKIDAMLEDIGETLRLVPFEVHPS
jgi:hypothetical protein